MDYLIRPVLVLLILGLLIWALNACGVQEVQRVRGGKAQDYSSISFDSPTHIAIAGQIDKAAIIVSASDAQSEGEVRAQIERQLRFTMGQLNAHGAVADLSFAEILIAPKEEWFEPLTVAGQSQGKSLLSVPYQAKLTVSWPRADWEKGQASRELTLILPQHGDKESIKAFFQRFAGDPKSFERCVGSDAVHVAPENFFFWFRPSSPFCKVGLPESEAWVFRPLLRLQAGDRNTRDKYPEYSEVWKDGVLKASVLFSKEKAGASELEDAGVAAFNALYRNLRNAFGSPTESSLPFGVYPDGKHAAFSASFVSSEGSKIEIQARLIDAIDPRDQDFAAWFSLHARDSDLVAYAGHSGLGEYIKRLALLDGHESGRYQIYLINGCDSFAYLDPALQDKFLRLNPGYGPHKYLDLVSNTLPSFFHRNDDNVIAFILGLASQKLSYRELLSKLDGGQGVAVTGEEDNLWPASFN